ncbi:MAG: acetyl-CoA carboxylase carboxyl transferase subunit beta [Rhodospirillaceae bacterium]|nr:acetyl-CoA carboxylase carboxyl transferase subunit beta [Rhodospirillaceae bacterium]|tara:strand:- start:5236 stop:6105 length:870 start_codon:yes stop_codon:yes gene_type:complete
MNWLTNFVKPKIRAIVGKKDVPENLWSKCNGCGEMLFHRDLKDNLGVCNQCNQHHKISPVERFDSLFDNSEYELIETPKVISDPLKFRDTKKYTDRLKENRSKTGSTESIILAHGKVNKIKTVIASQNFSFMGGSLGMGTGESIINAANYCVKNNCVLIIIAAAGGARMQEGILSLMQLPRTIIAIDSLKQKKIPYISILTDPTTGGVTASYAMLGDISIAEPGALIGFAGPRVIENTIREKLPENFQQSEKLLQNGMLDMVIDRRELKETLGKIIKLITINNKNFDHT